MRILLTNDDGITAPGIVALAKRLQQDGHQIIVAAPESERSGAGHSFTLHSPLSVTKPILGVYGDMEIYAISGTPVDCVLLATAELVKEPLDLVLSGINAGSNIGTDVVYSGTVNAALEGCICGVPSISLSQFFGRQQREIDLDSFKNAAELTAQIIKSIDISALCGFIYNINFPAVQPCDLKGIKVCGQGVNDSETIYEKLVTPSGKDVYWISSKEKAVEDDSLRETDVKWLKEGYITVTPLAWNGTLESAIDDTKCKMANIELHL